MKQISNKGSTRKMSAQDVGTENLLCRYNMDAMRGR